MTEYFNQFARTELLFGTDAMQILRQSRVAVFGLGGVGGYVAEALARSGIGALDLIDNDVISVTNLNRQIYALHSTIGKLKVDVAEQRMLDINPEIVIRKYPCFFMPDTAEQFHFRNYDYVIDAIDTVTGKIEIIMQAQQAGIPVISSMGTGNKLDPSLLKIADIYQTSVCPLARVMRRELKKRNIQKLKVIYSEEEPVKIKDHAEISEFRKPVPASNAFVPSTAGLLIASEVIRDLIQIKSN
ncbi:MAG: tRNA threonylcarbamoyladenosine dehydratase [Oscillospiraceae bacterium]|nr:tRNA threonylcarbamoyladenosine dehydratase [Oscillospiraceae bacterium]